MQITISGKDKTRLKQVEDLARHLGLEINIDGKTHPVMIWDIPNLLKKNFTTFKTYKSCIMEITISGTDKKRLQQIEDLAKELGLVIDKKVTAEDSQDKNGDQLYKLMEEMAASGGITSIKDPVKWQREIRKDRKLYGRD